MLLSLVLITIYFREPANGRLHGVQSAGATVLRPFEVAANRVARPFRDAYGWFSGAGPREVRERRRCARSSTSCAQQVIQNADRGRPRTPTSSASCTTIDAPDFPQDFAPVTARSSAGRRASSTSRSRSPPARAAAFASTEAVVTADGLVGKVTQVAGHQAQVTLLTDPSMKVAALDLDAQAAGLVGHGEAAGDARRWTG